MPPLCSIVRIPAAVTRNRTEPSTSDSTEVLCRLGRNRRFVLMFEWLTLCPTWTPLPVTTHFRDILRLEPRRPRQKRAGTYPRASILIYASHPIPSSHPSACRLRTRPKSLRGLSDGSKGAAFETDNGRSALAAGTRVHASKETSATATASAGSDGRQTLPFSPSSENGPVSCGHHNHTIPMLRRWFPIAGSKGNTVRPVGQCRGCPRNCKRRAKRHRSHWATGKAAQGGDPRARRPAITVVNRGRVGRGELTGGRVAGVRGSFAQAFFVRSRDRFALGEPCGAAEWSFGAASPPIS
jgi:hypothetical protein